METNTPKKEWERLYPIVEPLVEKMRAKYPPELNIDGFEPALTQDIVEIVDSVTASRDEALIAGLEGMRKYHKEFECNSAHGGKGCYESFCEDQECTGFKEKPFNVALDEAIALIRGSKET